jgi:hypothetical protein
MLENMLMTKPTKENASERFCRCADYLDSICNVKSEQYMKPDAFKAYRKGMMRSMTDVWVVYECYEKEMNRGAIRKAMEGRRDPVMALVAWFTIEMNPYKPEKLGDAVSEDAQKELDDIYNTVSEMLEYLDIKLTKAEYDTVFSASHIYTHDEKVRYRNLFESHIDPNK